MAGTHVALLRGINVGRAKRVTMADLRSLVTDLGYLDVRTLLNSGNIVFTVPRAASGDPGARIEQAIAKRLGVTTRVTVLTAQELAAIVRDNPLRVHAGEPSRLQVAVLSDSSGRARLKPLTARDWAPEALALAGRASYLWCPKGQIDSPVAEAVARALGDAVTTRNWATITKLHILASEVSSGREGK